MIADVPGIDANTIACFMPNVDLVKKVGTRRIGTVHFVKKDLGGGLVAHELLHALLAWMVTTKTSLSRGEEKLCWEMGSLTRQFWYSYVRWLEPYPKSPLTD